MKKEEDLLKVIKGYIESNTMVRVYFKDQSRSPQYGKFVSLEDSKELELKGLVRFVPESKIEWFDNTGYIVYTRLMSIENFSFFKTF